MTKTPEELTEEWKAGKLEQNKDYYVETMTSDVFIDFYGQLYDDSHYPQNLGFDNVSNGIVKKILAPVPTYDEYKAMQEELAEHRHYCCCEKNEVMQLKLAEMEELLKECKKYIDFCCVPDGFGKSYIAEDLLTRINATLGESEEK